MKTNETISTSELRRHIDVLQTVRHPESNPKGLAKAAEYIRETFAGQGHELSEHRFDEEGREYSNIIATIAGSTLAEERVIAMAHFDTVSGSPGADDNASGVAVLLELGRVLRRAHASRTIQLIAVNLEEQREEGVHGSPITRGSRALAKHAREDEWDIAGTVVLECVGYAGKDCPQDAPDELRDVIPDVGDFLAVIANAASHRLIHVFEDSLESSAANLKYIALPPVTGNGEDTPDVRRSDHAPFWDEGYKAIMLTDTGNFRNPHYHKKSDTLETLNLDFTTEVCKVAAAFTLNLATPPLWP